MLAPKLTLLAFIAFPVAFTVAWIFRDKVKPLQDKIAEYRGRVYTTAFEGLSNTEAVKTYRAEDEFEKRVRAAGEELRDVETQLAAYRSRLLPTVNFGVSIVLISILGIGGEMALSGSISVGTLVAYYFYVSRSLGPVRQTPDLVFGWYRAKAAMERLEEILESEDELPEAKEPAAVPEGNPVIEFEQVEFSYRDRATGEEFEALRGISFAIEPQERLVILGPSGSGKSTTGKLVPRLFDPDRGSVTADGTPLSRFEIDAWRSKIGYVGQEVSLFHGTIRDNVAFAIDEPDEAAFEKAVRVAAVDEMASEKTDGLETLVGEKGTKLSGGQRKRVAMARALLREPDILVVDQFAADIEQRLCRKIFEAIRREYDVSILYLGHRIPAGLEPDQVYWMEHGEIAEHEFTGPAAVRG